MFKRLSITLLIIGLTSLALKSATQAIEHSRAVKTIETYSGETYQDGDCETKDLWESDDNTVIQACNALEG